MKCISQLEPGLDRLQRSILQLDHCGSFDFVAVMRRVGISLKPGLRSRAAPPCRLSCARQVLELSSLYLYPTPPYRSAWFLGPIEMSVGRIVRTPHLLMVRTSRCGRGNQPRHYSWCGHFGFLSQEVLPSASARDLLPQDADLVSSLLCETKSKL